MDMTVIGNLTHHVIDDELVLPVFIAPDEIERLDHESAFLIGGCFAMFPQYCHRGIARVTVEQRKLKRKSEGRVPRGILFQFAKIAFGHNRKGLPICRNQDKIPSQSSNSISRDPR